MRLIFICMFSLFGFLRCTAQPVVPAINDALSGNRERMYKHIVTNTITKNLSAIISDSTEDRWEDAFYALELLQKKSAWIDNRIKYAVQRMPHQSISFQRSLLELLYANYPDKFNNEVLALFKQTLNGKIFALCGEYLLRSDSAERFAGILNTQLRNSNTAAMHPAFLSQLSSGTQNRFHPATKTPSIHTLLSRTYLPGSVIMISFQRRNRDWPGLVMIRDTAGNFVSDSMGYFALPQLARSINGLPGYLTNGNTPEGILRMDGMDISRSSMIGPTLNVQLTLPFEFKANHFFQDSTLTDSSWDRIFYSNLLPDNFRQYDPMWQSYDAGSVGRTEIIAHGTTVDPNWYANDVYYPLTPTLGCLTTKEIWDAETGKRTESHQQLLADAIIKAGGANGYAIVINIDDRKEPVTIEDILPFLKLAGHK